MEVGIFIYWMYFHIAFWQPFWGTTFWENICIAIVERTFVAAQYSQVDTIQVFAWPLCRECPMSEMVPQMTFLFKIQCPPFGICLGVPHGIASVGCWTGIGFWTGMSFVAPYDTFSGSGILARVREENGDVHVSDMLHKWRKSLNCFKRNLHEHPIDQKERDAQGPTYQSNKPGAQWN